MKNSAELDAMKDGWAWAYVYGATLMRKYRDTQQEQPLRDKNGNPMCTLFLKVTDNEGNICRCYETISSAAKSKIQEVNHAFNISLYNDSNSTFNLDDIVGRGRRCVIKKKFEEKWGASLEIAGYYPLQGGPVNPDKKVPESVKQPIQPKVESKPVQNQAPVQEESDFFDDEIPF